jgi:hypothetical protein
MLGNRRGAALVLLLADLTPVAAKGSRDGDDEMSPIAGSMPLFGIFTSMNPGHDPAIEWAAWSSPTAWVEQLWQEIFGHKGDIFINVVASAIWALLGALATLSILASRWARRRRKAGKTWAHFLRSTRIIIDSHAGEIFDDYEISGMTGLGDVRAVSTLTRTLQEIGAREYTAIVADEVHLQDQQDNLILVGGPSSNRFVQQLLPQVTDVVRFPQYSPYDLTIMEPRRPGGLQPPGPREWAGGTFKDYGVVVVAPNPVGRGTWVAIVLGGTGLGTLAAAERLAAMRRERFARRYKNGFTESFYVPVRDKAVGAPRDVLVGPAMSSRSTDGAPP